MVIIVFSQNLNSNLIVISLFIIFFWLLWMNIGYIWHRVSEKYPVSILLGLKIFFSSLIRTEVKSEYNPVVQSTNRKVFLWLALRWFLFIIIFPYTLISFLNPDNYNLIGFVLLLGVASLSGVFTENEIIHSNQNYTGSYGKSPAIYELVTLLTIVLWSWDLQSFSFITIMQSIWVADTNWGLIIHIFLLLIMLFSVSLGSDYLGYKRPAPFDVDHQKTSSVSLRLRTLYSASQSFFQILIIMFLALINLNFVSGLFFNSPVSISILSLIFLILCFLFSISILILSSLSYRLRFADSGSYLPVVVVGITLLLIVLYLNGILPIIRII